MLEQPYALTLWAYYQLNERKRISDLIEQVDAVNKATLAALAFNEPNKLSAERDAVISAAKAAPKKDAAAETAWRERAAKLVAALEEGQVLADA